MLASRAVIEVGQNKMLQTNKYYCPPYAWRNIPFEIHFCRGGSIRLGHGALFFSRSGYKGGHGCSNPSNSVAAISFSLSVPRLDGVKFGFWLTGKLGCAWVCAWVVHCCMLVMLTTDKQVGLSTCVLLT